MKKFNWLLGILFSVACGPSAWAQPVSVTWPLTNPGPPGWTSSQPSLAVGSPEILMGGPAPQIQVFDYWSGQAQRLWSGTTGWFAGSVNPTRYLQFDAAPTAGNQLSVTSVSFNYGGAGINGHVRSEVRYSVDGWNSSTLLNPALAYPNPAMVPFTMAVTPPPVPSGQKFSLRIFPYAILNSIAVSPTFASHNSVVINGTSAPVTGKEVRFDIRKTMGEPQVAGTYLFTVTCTGPGGPTGPTVVSVVYPSPGTTPVSVPSGSICGIVETPPTTGNWGSPNFSGVGVNVQNGAPWNAKAGPITASGGTVLVANRAGKEDPKAVRFDIRKTMGEPQIPGTYLFTVTCTGPGGPTGPTVVSVVYPSPGTTSVSVPSGSVCGIVETQPTTGNWGSPNFSGVGVNVQNGAPWNAKAGPITASGGTVLVANRAGKEDPKAVRFDIRKTTGAVSIPGTYLFTVTCTGPGGPYTGPNPVSVVLPAPGVTSVSVPSGSVCGIVETQPTTGTWSPPNFSGNGMALQMGADWEAKFGPLTGPGGTVLVTNRPTTVADGGTCPAYTFTPNLNVGTMIPSTSSGSLNHQTNNGTVEKYCYGDAAGKCATYGGLYEWNEAMGYAAGNNNDLTGARVQGICPAGFHIPSDLEMARYAYCLESSVAPTGPTPLATFQNQSNFAWMGSATAGVGPGTKMKTAFGSFSPPWTGTNASGFAALPGGHRTLSTGVFSDEGGFTAIWTATPGSTSAKAHYFALDTISSSGRIGRNMALNGYGLSVRCLKDY